MPPNTPTAGPRPTPGELALYPTACGSFARLAVLHYLAHRPLGATCAAVAHALDLDVHMVRRVLDALRSAERVVCEPAGPNSRWHVPCSRHGLSRSALLAMGLPTGSVAGEAPTTNPPEAAQ